MLRCSLHFLFLSLVILSSSQVFAGSNPPKSSTVQNGPWFRFNRSHGPFGGASEALFTQGSIWYLGTFGGVHKSTNQGTVWSPSGLEAMEVFRIGGNGTVLLASVDSILYRSTNQAGTWDSVWRFDAGIQCIANDGSTLYVTLDKNGVGPTAPGGGIFKSTDNGVSWSAATTGQLQHLPIRAIVPVGSVLVAITKHNGVYRSIDSGGVWSAANTGLPTTRPDFWSVNTRNGTGSELVIAGSNRSLYFSVDTGLTWQAAACSGIPGSSGFYCVAFNGQVAVASTLNDSAFVSTDNGATWTRLGGSFPQNTGIYSLTPVNGKFLAGTDRGLHESIQDGVTWHTLRNGLNAGSVYALAVRHADQSGQGLGTVFAGGDAGAQWSADTGATWRDPADGTYEKTINTFLVLHDTLYAGGEGFYQFSDAANSWSSKTQQGIGMIEDLQADSSGRMFAAVGVNGVAMSTDRGVTWVPISTGLPVDSASATSLVVDSSNLYVVVNYTGDFSAPANCTGVWHSSDRGGHWVFAGQGLQPDITLNNLLMPSAGGGETFVLGTSQGYYVSSGGETWNWAASMFHTFDMIILPFRMQRSYVLSGVGQGIYATLDDGNWYLRYGLQDPTVISSTWGQFTWLGYVGTMNTGAWQVKTLDDTAVDEYASGPPSTAHLEQNYPNPMQSSNASRIVFSISEPAHVLLAVQDMLGRTVATLVDEQLHAGSFIADFNGAGLPAGTYQVVLRSGEKVVARRMEIVR